EARGPVRLCDRCQPTEAVISVRYRIAGSVGAGDVVFLRLDASKRVVIRLGDLAFEIRLAVQAAVRVVGSVFDLTHRESVTHDAAFFIVAKPGRSTLRVNHLYHIAVYIVAVLIDW